MQQEGLDAGNFRTTLVQENQNNQGNIQKRAQTYADAYQVKQ